MDSPSNKRKKTLDLTPTEEASQYPLQLLLRSLVAGSGASHSTASITTPTTTTTCTTTSSAEIFLGVVRIPEVPPKTGYQYVPRYTLIPPGYKFLPRKPLWSSPPPDVTEKYVSSLLELLEMRLDPYLCEWIYEYLTLSDLWGLAQVSRQRMVTFRIAMLGGVGTHIPSALQTLYMHKLGTVRGDVLCKC